MNLRKLVASTIATAVFLAGLAGGIADLTAAADPHLSHDQPRRLHGPGAHGTTSVDASGDEATPHDSVALDEYAAAAQICCPVAHAMAPGTARVVIPDDQGAWRAPAWAQPPDPWVQSIYKPPRLDS